MTTNKNKDRGGRRDIHVDGSPFNTFGRYDELDSCTQVGTITVDEDAPAFRIKRGKALMISINNYERKNERRGNKYDRDAMELLLHSIGFDVEILEDKIDESTGEVIDLKPDKIINTVREWSEDEGNIKFKDTDCLIIVIMTHGGKASKEYIEIGRVPLNLQDIYEPFSNNKCKSLLGKPKLLFLQHCRGTQIDFGVMDPRLKNRRPSIQSDSCSSSIRSVAKMSEFFFANACFEGYVAYLSISGSWFIQEIVKVFMKRIKEGWELHRMMLEVHRNIQRFSPHEKMTTLDYDATKNNIVKEAPCFKSSLTKELFFEFKNGDSTYDKLVNEINHLMKNKKDLWEDMSDCAVDNANDQLVLNSSRKRTHSGHEEVQTSPVDEADSSKRSKQIQRVSFSQENTDINIEVVHHNYPKYNLNDDHFVEIKDKLFNFCLSFTEENSAPTFSDWNFRQGVISFKCFSKHQSQVEKFISGITLQRGHKLRIKGAKLKARVSLWAPMPSDKAEPDDVLKLIKSQNEGLRTESWEIVSSKKHSKSGQMIIFRVDNDVLQVLKEMEYKCYCGVDKGTFTVLNSSD